MRTLFAAAFSLLLLAALVVAFTSVQASGSDFGNVLTLNSFEPFQFPGGGNGMPYGSYQNSCQDVRMNGNRLEARCQGPDGRWHRSSLDMNNCRGAVSNDNGNLRCDNNGRGSHGNNGGYWRGGQMGNWQGQPPRGDYMRSCQNVHMNGNRLEASCQTTNGRWRDTSVDLNHCRGNDITNDDGRLRCQ